MTFSSTIECSRCLEKSRAYSLFPVRSMHMVGYIFKAFDSELLFCVLRALENGVE